MFAKPLIFENFQWISEDFFLPKALRETFLFSTTKVNTELKFMESMKKAKPIY